jgi:hypothetical protein
VTRPSIGWSGTGRGQVRTQQIVLTDPKARSSVVEHYLDTVGVGSSILPAPTTDGATRRPQATKRPAFAETAARLGRGVATGLGLMTGAGFLGLARC